MELVVLFAILALLIFGPRRRGGRPGRLAMTSGTVLLLWLLFALLVALVIRELIGPVSP